VHYSCGSDSYNDSYEHIGTIRTIHDWQRYFFHLVSAEVLVSTDRHIRIRGKRVMSYSMFRDDVLPSWEYDINKTGSEWGCREFMEPKTVQTMWLNLCADCVLGNLDAVGVRVLNKSNHLRNVSKVEVWMAREVHHLKVLGQIRESLKKVHAPTFLLLEHIKKKSDADIYSARQCVRRRGRR